jgi:hypothetical protein
MVGRCVCTQFSCVSRVHQKKRSEICNNSGGHRHSGSHSGAIISMRQRRTLRPGAQGTVASLSAGGLSLKFRTRGQFEATFENRRDASLPLWKYGRRFEGDRRQSTVCSRHHHKLAMGSSSVLVLFCVCLFFSIVGVARCCSLSRLVASQEGAHVDLMIAPPHTDITKPKKGMS